MCSSFPPQWLPELEPLKKYGGDWLRYVDALYKIYLAELVNVAVNFQGKRVVQRREPQTLGKDRGFWHICGDDKDDDGVPELKRYERIRWPRAIIDHNDDEFVLVWLSDRNKASRKRLYLWFHKEYMVVLEPHENYILLITAYCTDNTHGCKKLFDDYLACGGK